MTEGSSSSHDISASLRSIDSLIDLWFASPTPPQPPPARPVTTAPLARHDRPREHAKHAVNKLLLRAHAALTYSPRDGSTQTLRYADRAHDLATEHRLAKHRGRAQWFRGEALARLERWEDAYEAFVGSARVVAGGWRREEELRERMDLCWGKREEGRRQRREAERQHARTESAVGKDEKKGRRNVRFQSGEGVLSF